MVVPTLTAARRMLLRRRAWMTAWAAGAPLVLLSATCAYKALAGLSWVGTDAVTAALGYAFAAGTVLSAVAGAQSLHVLRTRHVLDVGHRSFAWVRRGSIVAIGSAAVWGLLSPALWRYFFGAQ